MPDVDNFKPGDLDLWPIRPKINPERGRPKGISFTKFGKQRFSHFSFVMRTIIHTCIHTHIDRHTVAVPPCPPLFENTYATKLKKTLKVTVFGFWKNV